MSEKKQEVRINASPASYSKGPILRAQRDYKTKIERLSKRLGFTGTVDVDYVGEESILLLEGFTDRGDSLFLYYLNVPHFNYNDEPDEDDDEEFVASVIETSWENAKIQLEIWMKAYRNGFAGEAHGAKLPFTHTAQGISGD